MTIKEHSIAVLVRDAPEHGLRTGDTGAIVPVMRDAARPDLAFWYSLEIFALDGSTLDVIDVPADAVRPGGPGMVPHARALAAE
jgi:hypothetical protein